MFPLYQIFIQSFNTEIKDCPTNKNQDSWNYEKPTKQLT